LAIWPAKLKLGAHSMRRHQTEAKTIFQTTTTDADYYRQRAFAKRAGFLYPLVNERLNVSSMTTETKKRTAPSNRQLRRLTKAGTALRRRRQLQNAVILSALWETEVRNRDCRAFGPPLDVGPASPTCKSWA
jgi:hypothetical protein